MMFVTRVDIAGYGLSSFIFAKVFCLFVFAYKLSEIFTDVQDFRSK